MSRVTAAGLILYCAVAGAGLFIDRGISHPLVLFPWVAGYLYLLFRISFDAYISRAAFRPFPLIVLGVILLNFLIQITGGVRSYLWPVYFLYAVVIAAFSPPRRVYAMVAVILAVESANLLLTVPGADLAGRWHVYAGFGLTLAAVSAAASHIMQGVHLQVQQARTAHDQLIAHAEALDPLSDPEKLESLMSRRTDAVRAALQRESSFNGLIDMIGDFVPAHTYAVFVRERRDQGEVFVLRAIRSQNGDAAAPVGSELSRETDRTLVDMCAEQQQRQYIADFSELGVDLSKLGYYRKNTRPLPIRAVLMSPIAADDTVIAVLALDSLEPGAFSLENQDMLSYFSPFFIQTIQTIQMTLDQKARADHYNTLHKISEDLNSSLRFDEIMETVLPKIMTVVPADYCACLITADQTEQSPLRFAALRGYDPALQSKEFSLAESAVIRQMHQQWTDRKLASYYSDDLGDRGKDLNLFPFKEMRKPIRSLYGRLLHTKESFLGALFIASERPQAFNDYQRGFYLDTLINQISMVAYNSLLFQRIENMARTDGLTGLLNHRTFMEKLQEKKREMERTPHPFSILLMDIDKFKGVNDKYGHPVGDLAIKAVSRVLRETARTTDFVARYGGEEFAVGMIETDSRGALQMAERLRTIMEKTVVSRVFDGELKVTLSIGVASFPEDTRNITDLVTLADEALYHAKRTGRNRACLYREAAKAPLPAEKV